MPTSASPTSRATQSVESGSATSSASECLTQAPANALTTLVDVPAAAHEFMAELHLTSLPLGFFGSLGKRFLRQYYRTFLASPHASAILAVQGGRPVGFVVGTLRPVEHLRWTLRSMGPQLALAAGIRLIRQPQQLVRFVRTRAARYGRAVLRHALTSPRTSGPERTQEQGGATAVLWHVAVASEQHGCGIGRQLVSAFLHAARAAGDTRAVLTTQSGDAAAFYERLGWSRSLERFDQDGNVVLVYETVL